MFHGAADYGARAPNPPYAIATPSRPEMFREFEALRLVVRADAVAVERVRPRQHLFVDQAADNLTVFENERDLARTHFEHGARAAPAGPRIAKARVEEARIVHTEFADQRIERDHFGRIIGRHLNGFLGSQDIEFIRVEDQAVVAPRL